MPPENVSNKRNRLNALLQDPVCKRLLQTQYNIDAKSSVKDGVVQFVDLRKQFATPKPVKTPVVKPVKIRDPRLPPVGTAFKAFCLVGGVPRRVDVREAPEGVFSVALDSQEFDDKAKSLTGALMLVQDRLGTKVMHGRNGFKFFDLTVPYGENEVKKPVDCPCGRGKDTDGDGDCPACAHDKKPAIMGSDLTIETSNEPSEKVADQITDSFKRSVLTESGLARIAHRTRPCVLWGVQVLCLSNEWIAFTNGLVARGDTPEKALENWDTLFTTGMTS